MHFHRGSIDVSEAFDYRPSGDACAKHGKAFGAPDCLAETAKEGQGRYGVVTRNHDGITDGLDQIVAGEKHCAGAVAANSSAN